MCKHIMIGADVHDKSMLLMIAEGRGTQEKRSFANDAAGRKAMVALLESRARQAGHAKVSFAYEASCLGFGLCDMLLDSGFECHVLAPTNIARPAHHRRRKTDEKDAKLILEVLRGHLLAGNRLPSVWIPDPKTRDDREIVRARIDATEKLTALKAQVRTLLKRNGLVKPPMIGKGWTKAYRAWLRGLLRAGGPAKYGARVALGSFLRQMAAIEEEIGELDSELEAMLGTLRYAEPARALMGLKGVGRVTALVFLTELGDMGRFRNRKQVGAFLGLVPSSNESGESGERKGHITRQGPWRVRRVLCQATWARIRTNAPSEAVYRRIERRNPKHKKIAVVAVMRRLGIRMWRVALQAQRRASSLAPVADIAAA